MVDVPRLDPPSFRVDVEGIQKAVAEHNPKILFLTSPNNPDGSMLSNEDLETLLQLPVLVVLDEAYIEFSGYGSVPLVHSFDSIRSCIRSTQQAWSVYNT